MSIFFRGDVKIKDKEQTELEEYNNILKSEEIGKQLMKERRDRVIERGRERMERKMYLENKFNPTKDKPLVVDSPTIRERGRVKMIKREKTDDDYDSRNEINALIALKNQHPEMSLETAILRTLSMTKWYYEDEEIIKKFNLYKSKSSPKPKSPAKSPAKSPSPPAPPPIPPIRLKKSSPKFLDGRRKGSKPFVEKLIEAKEKLKRKSTSSPKRISPPVPPPMPSLRPKALVARKKSSKPFIDKLKDAKGKLKMDKNNPDYDIEMAFKNL